MNSGIKKTAFILLFVFLVGCGKEESMVGNREDVSAKIEDSAEIFTEIETEEPVLAETECKEDILKEVDVQYPLIATPSDVEWIDLVIVSEENYCIFDGEKYGYIAENG
ncbi:MAG: hypothetical protein K2J04_13935, partial [Lachnospiraceae bacterium]|nr:hypothetical protein [Lachnospiraceae bacterium]